jgi:enoyl-CoA hydratase
MSATEAHPDGSVTVEEQGDILLIGIDRPEKYNALSLRIMKQISAAYKRYDQDDKLRCAVLFGHGKAYCAGADLANLESLVVNGDMRYGPDDYDPFGITGRRLSKPLITAAHGVCFAGGLEIALSGDIIVAAQGTKFGQMEVQRGIFAFAGGAFRWVERAGWGNAQRYLLTGDTLDAEEARRIGLVQDVVEKDQALPFAIGLARKIAAASPLGIRYSLACSRQAQEQGVVAAAAKLGASQRELVGSEDAREGLKSFNEKRPGNYTGR